METLLLIDDDPELCRLLQSYLRNEGYTVDLAHNGNEGLHQALHGDYSAILLDIMLPQRNGIEVLQELRKHANTPVIMLTAKGEDLDRIIGLELGADDYLPKPCNPRELVARLRAVLRRSKLSPNSPADPALSAGQLNVDEARYCITYRARDLGLTKAEYQILRLLILHSGDVLAKEQLYEQALGRPFEAFDRSLDMHISNIRKKLAQLTSDELLLNVRGIGYRLNPPASRTC